MQLPALNPGSLKDRITFQDLVETDDTYGQPLQSWKSLFDRWAEVRTPNAREQISAEKLNVILSHVITVRHDPAINATQRILYDDRKFKIISVSDPEERKRLQVLICCEISDEPDLSEALS